MAYISIADCRSILGAEAKGHSDEEIRRLRDSLEKVAEVMYDEIAHQAQRDQEAVRWSAYGFENLEEAVGTSIADDPFAVDGPNLLDFPDEEQ